MFKEWIIAKTRQLIEAGYLVFDGKKVKLGSRTSIQQAKLAKANAVKQESKQPSKTKFGLPAKYHVSKKKKY